MQSSKSHQDRFSPEVRQQLEAAGWHPGRIHAATLPSAFAWTDQAKAILAEFSGLEVGSSGPGRERARSRITFDPSLAQGEDDRFDDFAAELASPLCPLGEVDGGHAFLALDTHGRVYLLMEELLPIAETFDEALEKLLLGLK